MMMRYYLRVIPMQPPEFGSGIPTFEALGTPIAYTLFESKLVLLNYMQHPNPIVINIKRPQTRRC